MCIKINFWLNVIKKNIKLLGMRKYLQVLISLYFHHFQEILTKVPILFSQSWTVLVSFWWNFCLEFLDLTTLLFKLHIHLSDPWYTVGFLQEEFKMRFSCYFWKCLLIRNNRVNIIVNLFFLNYWSLICGLKLKDRVIIKFILKKHWWNWFS